VNLDDFEVFECRHEKRYQQLVPGATFSMHVCPECDSQWVAGVGQWVMPNPSFVLVKKIATGDE